MFATRSRDVLGVGIVNRFDDGLRWKEKDETDRRLVGEEVLLNIDLVLVKAAE